MKKVKDVLGKGWEHYAEDQKLQSESNTFRKKPDTRIPSLASRHQQTKHGSDVFSRLSDYVGFLLAVNFNPQIITLFKEVRNQLWLNFYATSNLTKDSKRVYPHAVSLMETVRTYGQTLIWWRVIRVLSRRGQFCQSLWHDTVLGPPGSWWKGIHFLHQVEYKLFRHPVVGWQEIMSLSLGIHTKVVGSGSDAKRKTRIYG